MKILERNEISENIKWNLKDIYESTDDLKDALKNLERTVHQFNQSYKGKLNDAQTCVDALDDFAKIETTINHISVYTSLYANEDQTNPLAINLSGEVSMHLGHLLPELNFLNQELSTLNKEVLEEIGKIEPEYKRLTEKTLNKLPHRLDPKVENALSLLSGTLDAPYEIYNMAKLADMTFEPIKTKDKTIEMNFGYFEDALAFDNDDTIRHQAFDHFSKALKEHENTFASVYAAEVLKEKAMGKLMNFDNTIDYLLFDQEITADIYNNQLDVMMEELAPHMRKFAKLLKETHHLETMTTNDLHLVVDPDFEPNITIEASRDVLKEGLSILGEDYVAMIDRAFDERWIDFPQNKGKSTGAFCSTPVGIHPYVLISWTEKMREVFVLAHELGHAGHFLLSGQNQVVYNMEPSLYLIESPSTMNEILMAKHLKTTSDDPRFQRWILSTLISRTYYHNFVTHFLEAYYQREVYRRIDKNQPISAHVLNDIFKSVLEKFWGDDIEISDGAELTWMRQPHYYMGLYPYTYAAGLSIATESSKNLIDGKLEIEDWKNYLKAGGSKNPIELAEIVKIDLNTDEALRNTIDFIGETIDEIIKLSKALD